MEKEEAIELIKELDCENCDDKGKCNFNDLQNCYAEKHIKIQSK